MTTAELADRVARSLRAAGAVQPTAADGSPVPPCSINVNEELTHALPGDRVLRAGDLVTVDVVCCVNGWWGDHADSWVLGPAHSGGELVQRRRRLAAAAKLVTSAAIRAAGPGVEWSAVARRAENAARGAGVALVPGFAGHRIGHQLHLPPARPIPIGSGVSDVPVLAEGDVFTIEPIVCEAGTAADAVLVDDARGLWVAGGYRGADAVGGCFVERAVRITRRGATVLANV